ncbi:hypothetical protein N9D23_06070 [Rubripirellula sp.]|jgi:Flp pilus assembly protein TadB|nr:hypothetical protein [Planctomycetaceae bacterium]MDA9857669.1 hypothetical protein [Rubripirellula sp.]MDF1843467.1 hypothetical protein [Rubripirellula sp.]
MQFEDLQVIWNSQRDRPLYGFDEAGLQQILRGNRQRFQRFLFWQHVQTYGSTLFMLTLIGAILIANFTGVPDKIDSLRALAGWEVVALLVAMVCWLQFSLSVYLGQKMRKRREQSTTHSLREDLDKEICHTMYEIKARRNPLLGFIPPYAGVGLFLLVVFGVTGVSTWLLAFFLVVMVITLVIESRSQRRLAERDMTHRLRDLEILREKLVDPAS